VVGAALSMLSAWVVAVWNDVDRYVRTPQTEFDVFQSAEHVVRWNRTSIPGCRYTSWLAHPRTDVPMQLDLETHLGGTRSVTPDSEIPFWAPSFSSGQYVDVLATDYGWPFLSASTWWVESVKPGVHLLNREVPDTHFTLVDAAIELKLPTVFGNRTVRLPVVPRITGFTANALIYAVVCGAIAFLIDSRRRATRRLAGVCPTCKYDCRDPAISTCPECGTVIKGRTTIVRTPMQET
jgi:hypothetical protein